MSRRNYAVPNFQWGIEHLGRAKDTASIHRSDYITIPPKPKKVSDCCVTGGPRLCEYPVWYRRRLLVLAIKSFELKSLYGEKADLYLCMAEEFGKSIFSVRFENYWTPEELETTTKDYREAVERRAEHLMYHFHGWNDTLEVFEVALHGTEEASQEVHPVCDLETGILHSSGAASR